MWKRPMFHATGNFSGFICRIFQAPKELMKVPEVTKDDGLQEFCSLAWTGAGSGTNTPYICS